MTKMTDAEARAFAKRLFPDEPDGSLDEFVRAIRTMEWFTRAELDSQPPPDKVSLNLLLGVKLPNWPEERLCEISTDSDTLFKMAQLLSASDRKKFFAGLGLPPEFIA